MYRGARRGTGRVAFACGLATEILLRGHARRELRDEPVFGNPDLAHRVAITQRDRAVLHGVVIDRDAERRPDLVLAAIAAADRTGLVVVDREVVAERVVDAPRPLRLAVFPKEREDGGLVRREPGVEAEDDA